MSRSFPSCGRRCLGSTRRVIRLVLCLALLGATSVPAGTVENRQAAQRAAVWLESVQNPDGSWGPDPATRVIYTTAVVDAFRDQGRRGVPYSRGVTWLENHAATSLDATARRLSALAPTGDVVSGDFSTLLAGYRVTTGLGNGWGLSGEYAASALDTALVLIAIADSPIYPQPATTAKVQAGLAYLKASRTSDKGWAIRGSDIADPIVTATVLRALKRDLALDATLTTYGNEAASALTAIVGASTPADQKAHAALALLSWTPGTTSADLLLDDLVSSQGAAGDWQASIYPTAVALRAFAWRLGNNDPTLQAIVPIAEYGMRAAINLALGRNRGDTVRRAELRTITSLNANGFGIQNLTVLGELTGLVTLDLRNNPITDITPILGISTLQTVLLQNTPWAGRLCDLNVDGQVDSADVLLEMRMAQGAITPTLLQRTRADVGPLAGPGDGLLDSSDGLVLVRAAGGESLSVCNP